MANLVDVAGVMGRSPVGVPFTRSEVGRTGVLTRSAAGVVPVLLGGTGARAGFSGRITIDTGFGDIGSPLDYIQTVG
jgi:hypothetical protein